MRGDRWKEAGERNKQERHDEVKLRGQPRWTCLGRVQLSLEGALQSFQGPESSAAPSRLELNPHKTSPTSLQQQQEQKPTRNPTRNLPETYQDHSRIPNLPGAYQEPARNLSGICHGLTGNLPGTYQKPTRNLPATYKGPTGNTRNLPGTSQDPHRNLPGTYREPTRN